MHKITKSNKNFSERFFNLSDNNKLEKPYCLVTKDIDVTVWPEFVDSKLSTVGNLFIWAYHVRIENKSAESIKLVNRYWRIVDESGNVQEVTGEGVIGEQPIIAPKNSYQYSSGVHLQCSSGIMMGHYQMRKDDGSLFEVKIPNFSLDIPNAKGVVN